MFKTSLITLFVLFIACSPIVYQPASTPQAIPVVSDTQLCPAAEANLKKLGCIPYDKPYTPAGKTFSEFCAATQNAGIFLNPRCLSTITNCSQQDVCTHSTQ